MKPLPAPNMKAKPIAQNRRPQRQVSTMHSIRMLTDSRDRAKPGLERHEAGLHEEHEEGGDQHPHRVDRADQVVRDLRSLSGRRPCGVAGEEAQPLHQPDDRDEPDHLAPQDESEALSHLVLPEPSQSESSHGGGT